MVLPLERAMLRRVPVSLTTTHRTCFQMNKKNRALSKFLACVISVILVLHLFVSRGRQINLNGLKSENTALNWKINATIAPNTFDRDEAFNMKKAINYSLPIFKMYLKSNYQSQIDHHKISFVTNPIGICHKKLNFLVIIHSSLNNKVRRDTLRSTISKYATISELSYKVLFVVGIPKEQKNLKQYSNENSKYGDLLMVDVVDSYRTMTVKAVGWMKWVVEKCSKLPEFILKIDDDILLKIPQFEDMIKPCLGGANSSICNQMSCLFKPNEPALRTGKNKVTLMDYPLTGYPLFCPGLLYTFPATMLGKMLKATEEIPFLWLDDVYVTAFVMVHINKELNSLNDYIIHPMERDLTPLFKNKMAAHFIAKNFQKNYVLIWNKMIKSYNKKITI